MIRTMLRHSSLPDAVDVTGLTRPELLVSTSWLAENISRPELRVLDVRWRPDGSGPQPSRRATSRPPRTSTGGPS